MTYNPTALCQRCFEPRSSHIGDNDHCPGNPLEAYVPSLDEVQASVEELQQVIKDQARVILAQRAEFRYMAEACGLDSESRADQVREAVIEMASSCFAELGYVSAPNFESYMEEHIHELTLIRDPERLWRSKGEPVPVFRLRPTLRSRPG